MDIPPATLAKLASVYPEGTRHNAAVQIAIPLLGNGLPESAVFATLRDKFPSDLSDKELHGIVRWASGTHPEPSQRNGGSGRFRAPAQPQKARTPAEQAAWWLSGRTLDPDALVAASPVGLGTEPVHLATIVFATLYTEKERVNIVCRYTVQGDKTRPQGAGKTLSVSDWCAMFLAKGVPASDAGAWLRPNPVTGPGSGFEGAVTDADIAEFRFLLVESDVLLLPVQLALYRRLHLPVALILLSGGKSAHAWIRLDAQDLDAYRQTAQRILTALQPFGIDIANKNPSRLSRLPGAVRKLGAVGDGVQRLLWLNPQAKPLTPDDLKAFEATLEFPAIEDKPFREVILKATERYEELVANRGKLGVPTGLPTFDRHTGGLKPGTLTIICAETNKGKTTLALNFIASALAHDYGVALVTLEMDRHEIADLLVAMKARVNRNVFNTGEFTEADLASITDKTGSMANWPLWIFDEPTLTVAQIRQRVCALKAEASLGLVVVDYAQIVSAPDESYAREQQVASIAKGLMALARESRLPFVVLSQLNDEGKVRESRVIAHAAHNVLLLETDDSKNPPTMRLKVTKGRGIPKNSYALKFMPEFALITEQDNTPEERIPYTSTRSASFSPYPD